MTYFGGVQLGFGLLLVDANISVRDWTRTGCRTGTTGDSGPDGADARLRCHGPYEARAYCEPDPALTQVDRGLDGADAWFRGAVRRCSLCPCSGGSSATSRCAAAPSTATRYRPAPTSACYVTAQSRTRAANDTLDCRGRRWRCAAVEPLSDAVDVRERGTRDQCTLRALSNGSLQRTAQ